MSGWTGPWLTRAILAAVVAGISVYFLLGYCGWAPALVAPVLAGVIGGLIAGEMIPAAASGGLGGLAGGILASGDYTAEAFVRHFQAMPPYANPDVLQAQLYRDFLFELAKANPANAGVSPGPLAMIVSAFFVTAVVAGLTVWALRSAPKRDLAELVAGWVVVSALALVFVATTWSYASVYRASLGTMLTDGGYAYDGFVYQRAYQEMLTGTDYYTALVKAGAGDARLIKENAVRDGKYYSFISSPTLAREPWAFYLWRLAAPRGAQGVFSLALGMCAAVMLVMHWGLRKFSLAASLVAPVLLLPAFMLMCVWQNIFFPDFWGSLAMLASLALLVRKQLVAAAVLALAAAMFRETLVFWLIAVVVLAAVRAKSSPHGWRDFGVAGALFATFVGLYALHFHQAGQIIAAQANSGAGGFVARLTASSAMSLEAKFLAPLSYMMWPYGFFRFPTVILAVVGAIGFALTFTDQPSLRWTVAGYSAVWLLYYVTIGAASSYWGQQVLPFYLIGFALMLGSVLRTAEEAAHSRAGVTA